jgi:competence protein ComEC
MAMIFIYAAVTKEGAPVWRAALMFAIYLATRLLYRKRALLNALGAAALVLMISNPNALFGASLQMTILCVGVIVGVAVPLLERTIEPYARGLRNLDALAYDRSLPPRVAQFRIDLRLILGRLHNSTGRRWPRFIVLYGLRAAFAIIGFIVISGTMQLGMALPMAVYFHRATSVALPANLLVIPFLQLLMPAAVIAVAISYVSLGLAKIPAAIASFALLGITGTVHWLGGLRIADIRVATPGSVEVLIAGAFTLGAVVLIRKKMIYAMAGFALLATGALVIWTVSPAPESRPNMLEVTAIDVGQGDSILLVFPNSRTLLIDGGGLPYWTHSQMDIGEDVVSPYLWTRGISHLDAIALTHAHADHMGGLPAIIANFRPKELWLPEGIGEDEITTLLRSAERFGVKLLYRKAGDVFEYGGATVRVLAPDPNFPVRVAHRNDESLVVKVSYGGTSALLEADAEKGTERLVSSEDPAADVLKVAHHGSASGTNYDLLAAVHPRFAIISVGARNVYRHPRHEVLQRLEQAGARTYRTDEDGATTFYLDGRGVSAQLSALH